MAVTNIFTAGSVIVASEVNQNFDDLSDRIAAIDSSDIDPNAGITASQLSDRYALDTFVVEVLPVSADPDLSSIGAGSVYTLPAALTTLKKFHYATKTGKGAFLAEVEGFALDVTAASGDYPTLAVYQNGVLLGGGAVTLDADDGYFRMRHTNPTDSPLVAVADGDEFEIKMGSSGSNNPKARGVSVRFTMKSEVVS